LKKVLGIDVGNSYIKIVEIDPGAKNALSRCFSVPTPFTDSSGGRMIDHEKLKEEIFKKIPAKNIKEFTIAISHLSLAPVVMTLVLPRMGKKDLGIAAINEAKRKMIPAPSPSSTFETVFLGEVTESKVVKNEVLIVKEEKRAIDSTLTFLSPFGVEPSLISSTYVSYGKLLSKSNHLKDKEVAFIDIGHNNMSISIFKGKNVIFNRGVVFGCKDIITGLASGLEKTYDEAEKILFDIGIPDIKFDSKNRVAIAEEIMRQKYEAKEGMEVPQEAYLLEIRMLLEPYLERITQEVRRTFIYFKERFATRQIESIFFLGGGSLVKNLVLMIGKKFSPFPKVIDPFEVLSIATNDIVEDEMKPFFSGALSLAISASLKPEYSVNFLPIELRQKEEAAVKRSIFVAVVVLTSCAFLMGALNLWILANGSKRDLKAINFELGRLKDVERKRNELSARVASINQKRATIAVLEENKINPIPILRVITNAKVKMDTNNFRISSIFIGPFAEVGKTSSSSAATVFMQENFGNNPFSNASTQGLVPEMDEAAFGIKMVVNVFGDFEDSYRMISDFLRVLYRSGHFFNVNVLRPEDELQEITPLIRGQNVYLTGTGLREFEITSNLNI